MEKLFDVEHFISNLYEKDNLKEDFQKLDRLCKKIDVVKNIYRFYTFDLAIKKSDEDISYNTYRKLFYILTSKSANDYKLLNSALKLNDIMLRKSFISNQENNTNRQEISIKIKETINSENKFNEKY